MAAVVVMLSGPSPKGWAQEGVRQEEPTASSVRESLTAIERAFRPQPAPPSPAFPRLREELKDAPPFIRDAKVELNLRTFYRDKTNLDQSENEAWAGGGAIAVQSGWLLDFLSVGATFYTSQPLYAPSDRDGTQLLLPGQQSYTVVGQLYGRAKIADENFVTLGRYTYDTPYISRDDSRMTPNTFESYVLQGSSGGGGGAPSVRYGGGYISEIKRRNSEDFVSMSRAAGAAVDRGVAVAGALLSLDRVSLGVIDYYSDDVINIGYGEVKYATQLPGDLDAIFAAQYVDQRSVGEDLLTGSSFATDQFAVRVEAGRDGAILSAAYSIADDDAGLRNPWSGNPVYTSSQIQDFNRAGEQAALVKLSYDFSGAGLAGVTSYVLYAHGWTDAAAAGAALSEDEIDIDVQWRPGWEPIKGLWLRARYGVARVDQGGSRNYTRDLRLIANYNLLLF